MRALSHWVDLLAPSLVLAGGLVLAGPVAVDVAGESGPWAAVGAALAVGALVLSLAGFGEAHGDGVEPAAAAYAGAAALVLVGGSALVVRRRRRRRPVGLGHGPHG